jgi:hypothetical protein
MICARVSRSRKRCRWGTVNVASEKALASFCGALRSLSDARGKANLSPRQEYPKRWESLLTPATALPAPVWRASVPVVSCAVPLASVDAPAWAAERPEARVWPLSASVLRPVESLPELAAAVGTPAVYVERPWLSAALPVSRLPAPSATCCMPWVVARNSGSKLGRRLPPPGEPAAYRRAKTGNLRRVRVSGCRGRGVLIEDCICCRLSNTRIPTGRPATLGRSWPSGRRSTWRALQRRYNSTRSRGRGAARAAAEIHKGACPEIISSLARPAASSASQPLAAATRLLAASELLPTPCRL